MFINTHVFINSSVVYKLWVGGGGGEGSWNISSGVPTPPLALGQVRDLRISGSRAQLQLYCVVFRLLITAPRSPCSKIKCLRISPTSNT